MDIPSKCVGLFSKCIVRREGNHTCGLPFPSYTLSQVRKHPLWMRRTFLNLQNFPKTIPQPTCVRERRENAWGLRKELSFCLFLDLCFVSCPCLFPFDLKSSLSLFKSVRKRWDMFSTCFLTFINVDYVKIIDIPNTIYNHIIYSPSTIKHNH